MKLDGKNVLIPGASRPIGRQIARKFGSEGANLILPCFDWPESIGEMEEEFTRQGVHFISGNYDLRELEQVKSLATTVQKHFGSIDYLINNIERGGMPVVHGSYENEHNKEQWELEFATTVKAKWNLFTSFLPLLQHGGIDKAVVNISSISALIGRSGPASCFFNDGYSAANRAIQSLTETWAKEGAPNIRVNELMLGLITGRHGEKTRGWTVLTEQEKDALMDHTLLKRLGDPEDVADAVYFLAVEAKFMTGSIIKMDGGYTLGGDTVPTMPTGIL